MAMPEMGRIKTALDRQTAKRLDRAEDWPGKVARAEAAAKARVEAMVPTGTDADMDQRLAVFREKVSMSAERPEAPPPAPAAPHASLRDATECDLQAAVEVLDKLESMTPVGLAVVHRALVVTGGTVEGIKIMRRMLKRYLPEEAGAVAK